VLAGAGLGDDARLAHPAGQQDLTERVVDLVGAGVIELVALEVHPGAAELLRQAPGMVQRARAPDVVLCVVVEFAGERFIAPGRVPGALDVQNQRHQGLGDEPSAEYAEMAGFVRTAAVGFGLVHGNTRSRVWPGAGPVAGAGDGSSWERPGRRIAYNRPPSRASPHRRCQAPRLDPACPMRPRSLRRTSRRAGAGSGPIRRQRYMRPQRQCIPEAATARRIQLTRARLYMSERP